jgi:phospholipid/cholesterol/gamma-HCH transport system substrate-binding protein
MKVGKHLAGAAMILGIAGVVALAFAQFDGAFGSTSTVTVSAPRAGLVMDPDAKVKLRGVEIGRVTKISEFADHATLTLALQRDTLSLLPANVHVDIESTTVFGAKYVNLTIPQHPSPDRLSPGAHLAATGVTVEVNTLFQQLVDVLSKVRPEQVNTTLAALATALHGRGGELGDLLTEADSYLTQLNPTLPTLRPDLDKAADVTNLYADTAPRLLHGIANLDTTGETIVAEQSPLLKTLLAVIGLNDPGNPGDVLRANERDLGTVLDELDPSTALFDRYSPVLNCLIVGLDRLQPIDNQVFGGGQEGIALNSGFMYGARPYTAAHDMPKVHATGGPHCWGLPTMRIGPQYPFAPYLVDDTANVPYAPSTSLDVNAPSIFQLLYGNTYRGKPIGGPLETPAPGGRR